MELLRRIVALFRREAMDRELDEELQFHIEMKARATGDRFAAQRALGNTLLLREQGRDAWGWRFFDELSQDVRYALRGLRRSKGFAAAAILTLALAIGANCLVFSVADATVFRRFAFPDPDRLAYLWSKTSQYPRVYVSVADYLDWRANNTVFRDVGAYECCNPLFVSRGGYPERLEGTRATASFFEVAGIQAELGRTFLPEEELSARGPVMLLSDRLWRKRFGADPRVIGSIVSGMSYDNRRIDYTIVGVLPAAIEETAHFLDFWTPLLRDDDDAKSGGALSVVGRLKPGVTINTAQASMQKLVDELRPLRRRPYADQDVTVVGYHDELTRNAKPATMLLLAAAGLVALIACVNVANLMLARGAERLREFSIRSAVGAGRRRLVRQLLTESLAIGLTGGVCGTALAYASIGAVRRVLPEGTLRRDTVAVNGKVLVATLLVSILTGLLCGLLPAWRGSRANAQRGGSSAWRGALIVSEIALALVLMSGAGLMVNSLVRLSSRDLGFDRRGLFVVDTTLPWSRYRTPAERMPVEQAMLERLRALPGVRGAAIVDSHPLGSGNGLRFRKAPGETSVQVSSLSATPGYFSVMGIPVLRGRTFTDRDDSAAPRVVVADRTTAERYWPGANPIGKPIWVQRGREWLACEVIGIVGNTVGMQLNEAPQPFIYFPQAQDSNLAVLSIVLRGANVEPLLPAIRRELAAIDPLLAVESSGSIQIFVDAQLAQSKFITLVLAVFAMLALGLTVTGIAGVVAYLVRARTYEFGVRMALGARPRDLLRMVCGHAAALAVAGVAIGLGGALALTRLLRSYLYYDLKPADPATLTAVVGLVLIAALLASYSPARQAMGIDPSRALRHD